MLFVRAIRLEGNVCPDSINWNPPQLIKGEPYSTLASIKSNLRCISWQLLSLSFPTWKIHFIGERVKKTNNEMRDLDYVNQTVSVFPDKPIENIKLKIKFLICYKNVSWLIFFKNLISVKRLKCQTWFRWW